MADKVNLQKSYANLNEKMAKTFDESGVKRSFTIPYIQGQAMDEHVAAVSQTAATSGGLTNNLITTAHHSEGKGWGSGDGHTVGHPAEALRSTIIPANDENVKATVAAAQKHLDNVETLLGKDNPVVQAANGQLGLIKKSDGEGMNLLDFGVLMTQIMYGPNQAVAREHNGTKKDGHQPQLRGPQAAAPQDDQEQTPPDDSQGQAPADQGGAPDSAAASQPPQGASPAGAAPAAPQAQG